jgi:hypothetical protein
MDNWNYLYKIDYADKTTVTTNMLYTPIVNQEKTIMCMIWDESNPYQSENKRLTAELVNFFFQREVKHLTIMQKFAWCPRILEIDTPNRKIFIEWNKETINNIVLTPGQNLDTQCPDWREQIFNILKDIITEGYYKVALYPHCFFIGSDGLIKTFDFYSCVGIEERYIPLSTLAGMIGNESSGRFNRSTVGNNVDFKLFFEITMTEFLGKTWSDNPFPEFYKRLT